MRKKLANLLFENSNSDISIYEKRYPKRELKEGAIVTRFAPSPTGFVHMGSLRTAFIARKITKDTDGVFYIRIEDTDVKRTVENGVTGIINDLKHFEINADEGRISETEDLGNYGPYQQTDRIEIYKSFAKKMIEEDTAYPCFCSEDKLDEIRKTQEKKKDRIGYYGKYATCRNLTYDEVKEKIENGEKFVTRLKSRGNFDNKVVCKDLVKGDIEFPENDIDIVLLKSDFIPTYHFAHVVDDYLMRTTHILRGDEWLSSYPAHHETFKLLNLPLPLYCHLAPVNKKDGDAIRKLSKRLDPEAAVEYYHEKGLPIPAVNKYLLTTANSDFEEWMDKNPDKTIDDFEFTFDKMSASGSLFDLGKLINISKNYISNLTAEEVYNETLTWAKIYDEKFYEILKNNKEYSIDILNIERNNDNPRKDFDSWSSVKDHVFYMYDEYFNDVNIEKPEIDNYKEMLDDYINNFYDENHDKKTWFATLKKFGEKYNYAPNMRNYRNNKDDYAGSIADVSNLVRYMLTSKTRTPDLYSIMKILGVDKIKERFNV